jgi:hypothetical protein
MHFLFYPVRDPHFTPVLPFSFQDPGDVTIVGTKNPASEKQQAQIPAKK